MEWQERVYGYTGGTALIQAFATGYFVWDLYICIRYFKLFGPGMLAHAISALNVYSGGYVSPVYAPGLILIVTASVCQLLCPVLHLV
jgi:TLC domain